jgi:hypothetical protein
MRIQLLILISMLMLSCSAVPAAAGNSLLIEGPDGWTKHLEVTQGSTDSLVVLTPKEGDGILYDQFPDGSVHESTHYFLCNDRLPFHANAPGRHVLHYALNGQESNTVAVDVKGTPAPKEYPTPSLGPQPCAMPKASIGATSVCVVPRIAPISLSRRISSYPMVLEYRPVGAHLMNYQNGIVIPKSASQYHFGKDFSLGTIDNNYPGTPFLLQYLSDP